MVAASARFDVREVVNGIVYVLSTGCQWRYVPKDFPPKSTLYNYFDLWTYDGTLENIRLLLHERRDGIADCGQVGVLGEAGMGRDELRELGFEIGVVHNNACVPPAARSNIARHWIARPLAHLRRSSCPDRTFGNGILYER
jgi:hypothetical protein